MSIQTNITRIQTARDTIRAKAVELGIGGNTEMIAVTLGGEGRIGRL